MEIRVLRYFLEIARRNNMTRAAEALHISQPTLSKQIKDLETELGKKLFIRSPNGLELSDEGRLLKKRAEDILELVEKTEREFSSMDSLLGGDVYIGCAESWLIQFLARTVKTFREHYPLFRFHLISAGTVQVVKDLDSGLIDLAVIVEPPDLSRYNYLEIPGRDVWGVITRKDDPLAARDRIRFEDLKGRDIICSLQSIQVDLPRWCQEEIDQLKLIGTYNLAYNGAIFVKEGVGIMLGFDRLIDTGTESGLSFIPLEPRLENTMFVIWQKHQEFTPIARKFLDTLKKELA